MATKQKVTKRQKKRWFTVIAPDVFKNIELGEIAAFAPSDLVGRAVIMGYSAVTNSPMDKNKSFVLKVVRADEVKAYTEPVKVLFSTGYIGRLGRRSKTKFLFVGDYETKDGFKLTVKGYVCADDKTLQAVRTALRKRLDKLLADKLKRIEFTRVFEPNYMESLSKELKSKLHNVYPVRNILFWKVLVGKEE